MFDSFANNWQVEQAYAQILTHPDVPSVYWKHYFDWGSDLQNKVKALINARKMVGDTTDGQPWKDRSVTFLKNHGTPQKDQVAGINAGSKVDFQENARYSGIYAARVTGRNGELYVRIGGSDQQWQPSASGYSDYREYARRRVEGFGKVPGNPPIQQAPLSSGFSVPAYRPANKIEPPAE